MNRDKLKAELKFKAVRSSGAGGQNVNKVSSKVILQWDIHATEVFCESQRELLQEKLKNRINKEGVLLLECEETRSQIKNRELAVARFLSWIDLALQVPKTRFATRVPRSQIRKRMESKQKNAAKKGLRKPPLTE